MHGLPSQCGIWYVSEASEKEVLWGSWGRAAFQMPGMTKAGHGGCGGVGKAGEEVGSTREASGSQTHLSTRGLLGS